MKTTWRMLGLAALLVTLAACKDQPVAPQADAQVVAGPMAAGRATVTVVPDVVVGTVVGSCVGFDILADWTADWRTVVVADKAGNPAQEQMVYHVNGPSTYYNSVHPEMRLRGGPGEGQDAHLSFVKGTVVVAGLQWKVVLPGVGPIFMDAGELTIDMATNVITHTGGHHQWYESDFGALCQALTP